MIEGAYSQPEPFVDLALIDLSSSSQEDSDPECQALKKKTSSEPSDGRSPGAKREVRIQKALEESLRYRPRQDYWLEKRWTGLLEDVGRYGKNEQPLELLRRIEQLSQAELDQQDEDSRMVDLVEHVHLFLNYHYHRIRFPTQHHHENMLLVDEGLMVELINELVDRLGKQKEVLKHRKLLSLIEFGLCCFKRLIPPSTRHLPQQKALQGRPIDQQAILDRFLSLALTSSCVVPSMGLIAAQLFLQLDRLEHAMIAITPALIQCGDVRLRKIIRDTFAKASATQHSSTLRCPPQQTLSTITKVSQVLCDSITTQLANSNCLTTAKIDSVFHHLGLDKLPNSPDQGEEALWHDLHDLQRRLRSSSA